MSTDATASAAAAADARIRDPLDFSPVLAIQFQMDVGLHVRFLVAMPLLFAAKHLGASARVAQ